MDLEVPVSSEMFHNSPGFQTCTSQHPSAGVDRAGMILPVTGQGNSDSDKGKG